MRLFFSAFIVVVSGAASLHAQNGTSALSAVKLLPKGDAKRLARIEAREGNPAPERWYILVHNPRDESGLHEYVVAGGEVVASRALSQFAESLKPEDVIGGESLKVDSDRAGKVAQQYALANNVTPASFNYQLRKDDNARTPVWNVTCVDQDGKAVGGVVVAAGKGTVLSHTGFSVEPAVEKRPQSEPDEDRDRDGPRTVRKRYVVRARAAEPQSRQGSPSREAEKPNLFQRLFGGR